MAAIGTCDFICVIAEKFSNFPRSETALGSAPSAHRDKSGVAITIAKQSQMANGGVCTYETMERDRLGLWGYGDGQPTSRLSGLDRLKHPGLNKVSCHSTTRLAYIRFDRSMTARNLVRSWLHEMRNGNASARITN